MTSSASCGICFLRHVTLPSVVWCWDCDYGLCSDCREHHELSKASKTHETVPIDEYIKLPVNILNIKETCNLHDQKLQSFCRKHHCLCCTVCLVTDHGTCEDKILLESVIQNAKISNRFEETEVLIKEMLETIVDFRKGQEDYFKSFIQQRQTVEQQIREMRNSINNHLDKVENDLKKEITDVESDLATKSNEMIANLDKEEGKLTGFQQTLANLRKHGTNLQAFQALQQIQDDVNVSDQYIQSLVTKNTIEKYHVSVIFNPSLKDSILKIKQFGKVVIKSLPTAVNFNRSKNKQAQMTAVNVLPKSIDSIAVSLRRKINTHEKDVRGCLLLPDDTAVFSSYSSDNIRVFDRDGLELSTITIAEAGIYDIVYITNDNSIAVTSGGDEKQCITIIDMVSKQVTKTIPVKSNNSGITLRNDCLYVCARDKGLRMISLLDNSICDVVTSPMSAPAYVSAYHDKLYYTNCVSNAVTCCNLQGKKLWIFKDESILKTPLGIDCDNDGRVYVVGKMNNSVVVISPDGQHCRNLLSWKDGLREPHVLHYIRPKNQLLVANRSGNSFLFDMHEIDIV